MSMATTKIGDSAAQSSLPWSIFTCSLCGMEFVLVKNGIDYDVDCDQIATTIIGGSDRSPCNDGDAHGDTDRLLNRDGSRIDTAKCFYHVASPEELSEDSRLRSLPSSAPWLIAMSPGVTSTPTQPFPITSATLCLDCLYSTTDNLEGLILAQQSKLARMMVLTMMTPGEGNGDKTATSESMAVKEEAEVLERWHRSVRSTTACTVEFESLNYEIRLEQAMADRLHKARTEFNRVNRISVLNQCFFISAREGQTVSINHLRLGISATGQLKSSELNVALGDTILLVEVLARRLLALGEEEIITDAPIWSSRLVAISKNLVCRGSQSYVAVPAASPNDPVKPLYLVDSNLQWFFHLPKFNEAMDEFCAALQSLIEVAQKSKIPVVPVVPVQNGKVGGTSLRYKTGELRNWTNALGFVLINLKWLIGICSRLESYSTSSNSLNSLSPSPSPLLV